MKMFLLTILFILLSLVMWADFASFYTEPIDIQSPQLEEALIPLRHPIDKDLVKTFN